jgi:hypothetical protein
VADEIADVYRVESLEKYDLRDRMLIRLADLVFFCAISLIGKTIRWEVEGVEHLDSVTAAGDQPIYCLWHDRIFAGTYFLRDRGIVVLTSQSKDGEYIARFLKTIRIRSDPRFIESWRSKGSRRDDPFDASRIADGIYGRRPTRPSI